MSADQKTIGANIVGISIGVVGALIARVLNLPLPFIIGPVIAAVIAGRFGVRAEIHRALKLLSFLIIGLYLGSLFSEGFLGLFFDYWPAFLLSITTTLFITAVLTILLMKVFGLNFATAAFSALPGGILVVLDTAAQSDADLQSVTFLQVARVALGAVLIPLVVSLVGFDISTIASAPTNSETFWDWLIALPVVVLATIIALKIKLPSAALIAPMIATAALVTSGTVTLAVPPYLIVPGLIIASVSIGAGLPTPGASRFLHLSGLSIALFTFSMGISLIGARLSLAVIDISFVEAALAFAPAGLTETTTAAAAIGLQADFVAANNLLRLLLASILAPLIFLIWKQKVNTA